MIAEPAGPEPSAAAGDGVFACALHWILRHGWRLAVIFLGLLVFGLGVATTISHGYIHYNDFGYFSLQTLSGGYLVSGTGMAGYTQYDPSVYVAWMLAGLVLAAFGFFLWRRRFSLRSLLIAVLLIATTISVPVVVPPAGHGPFVGFQLRIMDDALTPAMRVELGEWLRAYLAPQALNAALPEQVCRAVGLKDEEPFRSTLAVDVSEEPDAYWLNTETDSHLTQEQLATLGEFHATYVKAILVDFYAAKKIPFTDTSTAPTLGGRWADWRDDWLKAHVAAPFVAPLEDLVKHTVR